MYLFINILQARTLYYRRLYIIYICLLIILIIILIIIFLSSIIGTQEVSNWRLIYLGWTPLV